jgi:hypothetical protein
MENFSSAWPFDSHIMSQDLMTLLGITDQIDRTTTLPPGFSFGGDVFLDEDMERNLRFSNGELKSAPSSRLHGKKQVLNPSHQLRQETFP